MEHNLTLSDSVDTRQQAYEKDGNYSTVKLARHNIDQIQYPGVS